MILRSLARKALVLLAQRGGATTEELGREVRNLRSNSLDDLVRKRLADTRQIGQGEIIYVITDRGRRYLQPIEPPDTTPAARPKFAGTYDPVELRPFMDRPGANDAFMCPSRRGNKLVWRDGRVETLGGAA